MSTLMDIPLISLWQRSVASWFKRKQLALTMHLINSYGRGFSRIHVSSIVAAFREKAPKLLKKVKIVKEKDIAGLLDVDLEHENDQDQDEGVENVDNNEKNEGLL